MELIRPKCAPSDPNDLQICIPDTVVDYRFSTVTDAIHLTHLDYPDVQFIRDIEEAKKQLMSGNIDSE